MNYVLSSGAFVINGSRDQPLFSWLMRYLLIILPVFLILFACDERSEAIPEPDYIEQTVKFVSLYEAREDFDGFMRLYAEDAVLEDIIMGFRRKGKDSIRAFLSWDYEGFQKIGNKVMEVETMLVQGGQAVISGYFTPFMWEGKRYEAMQFTTILTFDSTGGIIRHVDWINYSQDLLPCDKRRDANEWIGLVNARQTKKPLVREAFVLVGGRPDSLLLSL